MVPIRITTSLNIFLAVESRRYYSFIHNVPWKNTIRTTHPSKMVRAKQNGPPHKQTNSLIGLCSHQNNTNSVISTAQHRHLILTYYVLRQTHTTNSFVIAHYANSPHNPPNITHVVFKWRKQGLTTRMNPGKPFTQKPLLRQYVRTKSNLLSGGLTPCHPRLTLVVGRWR